MSYQIVSVDRFGSRYVVATADDKKSVDKFLEVMGWLYDKIEIIARFPVYPVDFIDEINLK